MLLALMLAAVVRALPRLRSPALHSVTRLTSSSQNALLSELKSLRRSMADELGLPQYLVYPNTVLEQMSLLLPSSQEEVLAIKGVGSKNVLYAKNFLEVIARHKDMEGSQGAAPRVLELPVQPTRYQNKKAKNAAGDSPRAPPTEGILEEDLSEEQLSVARRVLGGECTFITGSAGTGKSYLLRYLIQKLYDLHGVDAVGVTASTGIAALHIGGQTLHSFAGIGLAKGSPDELYAAFTKGRKRVARWRKLKVLIIDEISMLGGEVFEMLEEFSRKVRRNDVPFGGIQIVVVGDFLQLPPVKCEQLCFETSAWEVVGLKEPEAIRILSEVRRQQNNEFAAVLNEIRLGEVNEATLTAINDCWVGKKPLPDDGIVPTKLYCMNADVDKENQARLDAISQKEYVIDAIDSFMSNSSTQVDRKALLDLAEKSISQSIALKVGAQVMIVRNSVRRGQLDPFGMVNGQRGVVVGFAEQKIGEDFYDIPLVKFDTGRVLRVEYADYDIVLPSGGDAMKRKQVPLKLAWAITVHKSQGCTISRAELMIHNAFDYGQAYTALSRVTDLKGLWLTQPLTRKSILTNPRVLKFYSLSQSLRQ